ncbi:arylsulfatase [Duganella dendranthematis]|uniref:Arylsulfatase n=1 Tax=Duganella dendranthematis TaxID=2728021 RepID=A0ABX6ME54_9BURK|nr:arylsulfatase [Duganella dendranthematis]QJD92609.1 arylsulfatase [Duganella dendranthematis]
MTLAPRIQRAVQHGMLGLSITSALILAGCGDSAAPPEIAAAPAPVVKKKPNILYIMADDLGYSDIGAFGGEIETPNLDALVKQGRLLTNHHTGTVCAITRAMLVSGTDHHLVGEGNMGAPNDERKGLPGYEGFLNESALSFAQLLRDGGYHTYMAGKWHLGSAIAGGAVTTAGKTPDQWGFEHSYALLAGAASNHYAHEKEGSSNYTEDGKFVQPGQPGQPGGTGAEPFYSTDFYTKRLISYIDQHKADGKPFFAYAAYTSPHWPLQVSEPWLSKYKGKYDAGYDAVRNARIARQKQLGLVPADFKPYEGAPETLAATPATSGYGKAGAKYINANNGVAQGYTEYGAGKVNKKWGSLTALEKKAQARYMEIYAGMVDNLDHNIGLLIQHLKDIGEYDNTYVMFQSDNGAEGWPIDSGADPKATDEANATEPVYSALGTDNGAQAAKRLQYGLRWAEVSATPFRLTKGYAGEGSVSTPLIVKLPGQTARLPNLSALTHVTDNTATFLALAGIPLPSEAAPKAVDAAGVDHNLGKVVYNGRNVYPVTGKSLLPLLEGSVQAVRSDPLGHESYGRAFLISGDGKWKALWNEPPVGALDGHWELYDLTHDRGETSDVSAQNPAVTSGMVLQWQQFMTHVGGVEPLKPQGYY